MPHRLRSKLPLLSTADLPVPCPNALSAAPDFWAMAALQDQAWSVILRELPRYLARPTERQPHEQGMVDCYYRLWKHAAAPDSDYYVLKDQARDLLALVLAQKPCTDTAFRSHSDAKILLLRMALVHAQIAGQDLAFRARETYMARHHHRLDWGRVFAHPRSREYHRNRDQRVFLPIKALGETERDAKRDYREVSWTAAWNRSKRRRLH